MRGSDPLSEERKEHFCNINPGKNKNKEPLGFVFPSSSSAFRLRLVVSRRSKWEGGGGGGGRRTATQEGLSSLKRGKDGKKSRVFAVIELVCSLQASLSTSIKSHSGSVLPVGALILLRSSPSIKQQIWADNPTRTSSLGASPSPPAELRAGGEAGSRFASLVLLKKIKQKKIISGTR